ncbi:MAG: hypothetical protein HAW62_03510 [Endozoicomonadaceae bacterium]|nr:hypothetical protein [Endozoicomonadaceae bacterium]
MPASNWSTITLSNSQGISTNLQDDFLDQCAQYGQNITFQKADHQIPSHWKNIKGNIFWLSYPKMLSKNTVKSRAIVQIASLEEVINDPEIYEGTLAFNQVFAKYQLNLDNRKAKTLSNKQAFNIPSLSNKVQIKDLLFGEYVLTFLSNYHSNKPIKMPFIKKLKHLLCPLCFGFENNTITLIHSQLFVTQKKIQLFKQKFNQMMKRRIKLLNQTLTRYQKNTIAYIELNFELDCMPNCIQYKLTQLIEFEKQSFQELTIEIISKLGNQLAIQPDSILQHLQPLIDITLLWKTIWPHQLTLIESQINMQIQTLRIHHALKYDVALTERFIQKIEKLLFYPSHPMN